MISHATRKRTAFRAATTIAMLATRRLKKNHDVAGGLPSRCGSMYSAPYTAASAERPNTGRRKKAESASISTKNAP